MRTPSIISMRLPLSAKVFPNRRRFVRPTGAGVSVQPPFQRCHPWRLDPGNPCQDDGEGLNAYEPDDEFNQRVQW